MKNLLTLALLLCLSICCQSITIRDNEPLYDPSLKRYIYPETDVAASEPLREDRQLKLYKTARRSGRVPPPTYQYVSEGHVQEPDHSYAAQQPEAIAETYSYVSPDNSQQVIQQLGTDEKKHMVEQYLKEVTPTTKTTYNRRTGNYVRSNSPARSRGNKQQAEEAQRGIPKQSQFQYVLYSDLGQKGQIQPQIQYEIPEQKPAQSQLIPDQKPQSANLATHQNALLAHQKVLLETSNQDDTSMSSIYVSHTIPKKPVRKIIKPKQSAVDEDVDYYTQLQRYQQQLQQKQLQIYEQPAEVAYQTKLQYPSEDVAYPDATAEMLHYVQEKPVQQQQTRRYQQQIPTRQVKKSRHPPKYQPEQQTPLEHASYQQVEEPTTVQYQRPTSLRQGPKYLPEPKTSPYQEDVDLKYQPVQPQAIPLQPQPIPLQSQSVPVQSQPLISYEAAIAKLQAEQLARARQQSVKQQPELLEQEVHQYAVDGQQATNQDAGVDEYIRSVQPTRYRQAERTVVYRQPNQNSGVRYYRNLNRPVVFPNYE